jgi:hypothetical protein
MKIITKNTKLQHKINKLLFKILNILQFDIITVCQDKNNYQIDYMVITYGSLKDEDNPPIRHV